MTVTTIMTDKAEVAKIATVAASILLLYTGMAAAQPPEQEPAYDAGVEMSISTMCTVETPRFDYILDPTIERWVKFQDLAKQWRNERGAQSTVAAMTLLPSYQKIIGMGKDALPLILAELKSEGDAPDHWFWALAAISDENPVPAESRGNILEMSKAWLAWGQKEGHVQVD